jgi:hypothetical protein
MPEFYETYIRFTPGIEEKLEAGGWVAKIFRLQAVEFLSVSAQVRTQLEDALRERGLEILTPKTAFEKYGLHLTHCSNVMHRGLVLSPWGQKTCVEYGPGFSFSELPEGVKIIKEHISGLGVCTFSAESREKLKAFLEKEGISILEEVEVAV